MAFSALIGALRVALRLDSAEYTEGLRQSKSELRQAARELNATARQMTGAGKALTVGLTAPLLAAGAGALKSAANFESAMIRVSISTQATAGEMASLEAEARKIGKATIFSASEAAGAMDELAKTGLDVRTILGGAAEAAVDLAAAAGSQLEPAATAISDAIQQFGLSAGELPKVVNQITGAVNQSKLSFDDFTQASGQAGGVAANLGVSFEDFNAVIAGTSSLFSSGSDAGTSFKTFLTSLVPKSNEAAAAMKAYGLSFFQANGALKSMADVAEELRTKLGDLNDEARNEVLKTIFGTDAMRTAIGLIKQGADGLEDLKTRIQETDAAAQAAKRMQGFAGQVEQLKGAVEDLGIAIGKSGVLAGATALVAGLADMVDKVTALDPDLLKLGLSVAALAAAAGPANIAIGGLLGGLSGAAKAMVGVNSAAGLLKVGMAGLAGFLGPGGLILLGLGAVAAATVLVIRYFRDLRTASAEVVKESEGLNKATDAYAEAAAAAAGASGDAAKSFREEAAAKRELAEQTLKSAKAKLADANATLAELKASAEWVLNNKNPFTNSAAENPAAFAAAQGARIEKAAANVDALKKAIDAAQQKIDDADAVLAAAAAAGAAGGGGGGAPGVNFSPKAKAAREARDRSDERSAQISGQVADALAEELRQRAALAHGVRERAELDRQIVAAELQARQADIDRQIADVADDKGLSDAKKKELSAQLRGLKLINEVIASRQTQRINEDEAAQVAHDMVERMTAERENHIDILRSQQGRLQSEFARSQLAIKILDEEHALERAKLEEIAASADATDAEKQRARDRLQALRAIQANEKAAAIQSARLVDALEEAADTAYGFRSAIARHDWARAFDNLAATIQTIQASFAANGLSGGFATLGSAAGSLIGGKAGRALGNAAGVLALPTALMSAGSLGALGGLSGGALALGATLAPFAAPLAIVAGLATLFLGKKPSNHGAGIALTETGLGALSGNKRNAETEQAATGAAQAILQGEQALRDAGIKLGATVNGLVIGTRDLSQVYLSNGQAVTAAVGDAQAAAEAGLRAVLRNADFVDAAQKKLVDNMLAAGKGFDDVVAALQGYAEAQKISGNIADRILQLTDPQAADVKSVRDAIAEERASYEAAAAAGFLTADQLAGINAQLDTLQGLQLDEVLKRYAAAAGDAADAAKAAAQKALDTAQGTYDEAKAALEQAYDSEVDAIEKVRDRLLDVAQSLAAFKNELISGSLSNLDPTRALAAARAAFAGVAGRTDAESLAKIPELGRALIAASEAAARTPQEFAADRAAVLRATVAGEASARAQAGAADAQLAALHDQVAALIELNDAVLSVGDAIKNLATATDGLQAAQAALEAATGGLTAAVNDNAASVAAALSDFDVRAASAAAQAAAMPAAAPPPAAVAAGVNLAAVAQALAAQTPYLRNIEQWTYQQQAITTQWDDEGQPGERGPLP